MSPVAFVVAIPVLVAVLGAAFWLRRGATTGTASGLAPERPGRLRSALASARRRRIEGDAVGHFIALAEIERELGTAGAETDRLAAAVSRARFGGELPSPCELECLERRVERTLAALEREQAPTHERAGVAPLALHDATPKARARRAPHDEHLARRARRH